MRYIFFLLALAAQAQNFSPLNCVATAVPAGRTRDV
jgi:hypothetical protein